MSKKTTRNWRNLLEPAEKLELDRLDKRIKKLTVEASSLRWQRNRIQNRATVRAGK